MYRPSRLDLKPIGHECALPSFLIARTHGAPCSPRSLRKRLIQHSSGHAADRVAGQWYWETTSIVPTMLAFSSLRSSAGIQYSRMVWPPTW